MAKRAVKKRPAKSIPDPELSQIAQRKREQKKIAAGYAEIGRLARRIVTVRANVERELTQLANGIIDRARGTSRADDSLERSDG